MINSGISLATVTAAGIYFLDPVHPVFICVCVSRYKEERKNMYKLPPEVFHGKWRICFQSQQRMLAVTRPLASSWQRPCHRCLLELISLKLFPFLCAAQQKRWHTCALTGSAVVILCTSWTEESFFFLASKIFHGGEHLTERCLLAGWSIDLLNLGLSVLDANERKREVLQIEQKM